MEGRKEGGEEEVKEEDDDICQMSMLPAYNDMK
jgi:hypothetical protein